MIQTVQRAIEYSTRKAAESGLRKISGYVTVKQGYDTDPIYCITEQWGYDVPGCENISIYQIDVIQEYAYFPFRTQKEYNSGGRNVCQLAKQDMEILCNDVAEMIRSMGFYDYRVEPVPMHFYRLLHEKRKGLFGTKWITEKIDDGVGHVLKVTVSW